MTLTRVRHITIRSRSLLRSFRSEFTQQCSKRNMTSGHLERTAENWRNDIVSVATVTKIQDESKTVKFLTLSVQDQRLSFKAGQWVDMFIPGVETVGGFSMCSSPLLLQSSRLMELAVKYSTHPPAYWIHTQCKVGSTVQIRVGGEFNYDQVKQGQSDLLLIAGGVGINPLLSIINHVTSQHGRGEDSNQTRVMLLYSARNWEELIFKDRLDEVESSDPLVKCNYFVTREDASVQVSTSGDNVSRKRISSHDIAKCFDWLRRDKTQVFMCGPSPMIQDTEHVLLDTGVEQKNIQYEKWW